MPYRVSFIFNLTTTPTNRQAASAHSGSWSEGHWLDTLPVADGPNLNQFALRRSVLLPKQCDLIGWRIAGYTISGNKLLPQGVTTVKHRYAGNALFGDIGVVQGALQMSATITNQPNATRFKIKALPDAQVTFGEYQPTDAYKARVEDFVFLLQADAWGDWGAIVRDLAQPSYRVLSIAANNVTLLGPAGIAVGDYLRFRRVVDVLARPVSGAFRVTAVNAPVYTVVGLEGITANEGGFARKDLVKFGGYSDVNVDRVTTAKIGAPIEKYRGRRSKRRV